MPVTMRDVAQKAGVSIKTVSRVVNDQGEISDETRQRVMTAITELGYRPSRIARAMVTQRTHTVGMVIPDITNPFFPEVARGVQDLAQAKDYNVFICNTDEYGHEELQTLYSLADQAVDGIIVFTSIVSDEKLRAFADSFRPIIAINRYFEHPNVGLVIVDNYRGARLAMAHLLEKGHTAIATLTGNSASPTKIRRVRGYSDALTEAGLPVNQNWIIPDTPNMTNGYQATRQLLTQYPQITAIFAYNDLLALGALRACFELGRRVPADCAVIGFDDIQFASMVTPSLTTVHYDKYALGQMAINRLFEMIETPQATFSSIDVEVKLMIREST
jgi:LacI family transcriptional regulator